MHIGYSVHEWNNHHPPLPIISMGPLEVSLHLQLCVPNGSLVTPGEVVVPANVLCVETGSSILSRAHSIVQQYHTTASLYLWRSQLLYRESGIGIRFHVPHICWEVDSRRSDVLVELQRHCFVPRRPPVWASVLDGL